MKLRILALLLSILAAAAALPAQTPSIIEKAELAGITEDRLSAGLRSEIQTLNGKTYDEKASIALAERIQAELPAFVVTATSQPGSMPNTTHVFFIVAQNINSKYTVESVLTKGFELAKLSETLSNDIKQMVGHGVDDEQADSIRDRIGTELKNSHVRRSVVKGEQQQHVKIVYEKPSQNNMGVSFNSAGYHSRQKFSGTLKANYTWQDMLGVQFQATNNADRLMERFAGYSYGPFYKYKRVELEGNYSSYRAQWNSATLLAAANSPSAPGLYRLRDTIEPKVKVTVAPAVHITAAVANTVLQQQSPNLHFETVRTAKGTLDYSWSPSGSRTHELSGNYNIRAAGDTLGGSYSYTRHEWNQFYTFRPKPKPNVKFPSILDESRLGFGLRLARVTGNAPMFERLSLGNMEDLQGWNKYEISPLGASRTAYGWVEYGAKYFTVSFQTAALWDNSQPKVFHNSIAAQPRLGTLLRMPQPARVILNIISPVIAFPLRHTNARPMYIIGGGS